VQYRKRDEVCGSSDARHGLGHCRSVVYCISGALCNIHYSDGNHIRAIPHFGLHASRCHMISTLLQEDSCL